MTVHTFQQLIFIAGIVTLIASFQSYNARERNFYKRLGILDSLHIIYKANGTEEDKKQLEEEEAYIAKELKQINWMRWISYAMVIVYALLLAR